MAEHFTSPVIENPVAEATIFGFAREILWVFGRMLRILEHRLTRTAMNMV